MRKVFVGAVCCIALCLACSAFAGTEQGQVEVGGMVTYFKSVGDTDFDMSMWFVTAYGGYFVTDFIEVKGTASVYGGEDQDTTGSVGLGADFFFIPGADLSPYLGASGQMDLSEEAADDIQVEGHGGLKYFLSEATSVNMEARYASTVENLTDIGTLMVLVGLSVYL